MKYFLTASILLLFMVQIPIVSQVNVKIVKKEFKTENEAGFKEAWKSIGEGDKYFTEGLGTYELARDHYLFANQYNANNAALNYKIGVCYLFTGGRYEAIKHLYRAYELDAFVSKDIHYMLGRSYHLVLEFDKAIEHYQLHKQNLEPEELAAYNDVLARRLSECQHGKELTQEPVRVIIQNLGEGINSKYDDYNPIFAYGDTALFFTSRRPFEKSKRNPIDNKFNEDIYYSKIDDGEFQDAVRIRKPFNSTHNDAVVGISLDGERILLYKGHLNGGELQIAEYNREKTKWKNPKSIPKKLGSKMGETSACLSPDGKELYFISQNEELSKGGRDILISRLNAKGKWDDPINAGGFLNTIYNEEGVFITPDGNTMYFASQGHNSMGGYDMFKSTRNDHGSWGEPENLGYPINTPEDEFFFVTDQDELYGIYSAVTNVGLGGKDLFRVMFLGSEKELVTSTKDQLLAGHKYIDGGFLTMPQLLNLDTTLVLEGRVLDPDGDSIPILAKLTFIDPNDGSIGATAITTDSGAYTARLPEAKMYGVEINATGYLYFLDILDLTGRSNDQKIYQDFYLKRVEVGTKVVLENIYFQTGKAVLQSESFESLDQIYKFMENNPSIRLEISGHTDNTGSLRINTKLSKDRAKAVVDYLTKLGIAEENLVYEGYADSQPIAPNNTAEGREQNRRVEFKVISK